jgi:hypothetical protein
VARVEVKSLGIGTLIAPDGRPVQGDTLTLVDSAGTTVLPYSAATGATKLTSQTFISNSEGALPGFLEEGTYTATDPDGTSQTFEAVSGKTLGLVNVKAYGAVGDDSTSDSAAVQAAHDALPAAGGTICFPPSGTYRFGSYVTISKPVRIIGAGSTLKLADSFSAGAQGQGFFVVSGTQDVTVTGLRFDGNGGTLTAHATNNFAIWFDNIARATVEDCYFTALNAGGSNVSCALVWAGSGSAGGQALGNRFKDIEGGGVFFQGAYSTGVGNVVDGAGDVALIANTAADISFTGNTVRNCVPQAAFAVEYGAYDWSITGNTIASCDRALDINDAGYSGGALGGGVFSGNTITDTTKASSVATDNFGVHVRGVQVRGVRITGNSFVGLNPVGTTTAFVYVETNTEGLTIEDNLFEAKAQAVNAVVFNSSKTHTRPSIKNNVIRSTSSSTKLLRGIWLGSSTTFTRAVIAENLFENITNYGVLFDTSVSYTGRLQDNRADSSVGAVYQASPWGTFAPAAVIVPHTLNNSNGRSRWTASAAPVSGTWLTGDQVWAVTPTLGGTLGWACTSGGTPGTWKSVGLIAAAYTGTATWDPASTADGAMTSTTVTVTGATVGDTVTVGFSNAVPAGAILAGSVTAADTVTVTLFNKSGGVLDLASGTVRASVRSYV